MWFGPPLHLGWYTWVGRGSLSTGHREEVIFSNHGQKEAVGEGGRREPTSKASTGAPERTTSIHVLELIG